MTSFWPKNRQNDVIWRQKSISVKMLQIDWNFDTVIKSVKNRIKSTQKITLRSLWRHFGRFLHKKIIKFYFYFYGGLSEKILKNVVTMGKISIFELQIFFYNFWLSFSPIWPFFVKLYHFLFFTCFVLEVPENQWFFEKKNENATKSEIWHIGV